MNTLSTVFGAVLPVFALMMVGFGLRRRQWLADGADQSLLRVCVNLLLPSLIFENVLGNAALQSADNLLYPPLVGVATALAGMGVAWGAAKFSGLKTAGERCTFALTAGLQNYSYIPIPLCILLFDPGTVGVLLVHNVGVEVTLWTVGIAILSGQGWQGGWRHILRPPLVALVLALVLNAAGHYFPPPPLVLAVGRMVLTGIHWLGQSAIPMALLIIGAVVADHWSELRGGGFLRVVVLAILVRLVILPGVFLLLAKYLPCSVELKRVIVVEGAMASAVLPIALAKHYGGNTRIALLVVLGTCVAGLVATPLWIHIGAKFCGL